MIITQKRAKWPHFFTTELWSGCQDTKFKIISRKGFVVRATLNFWSLKWMNELGNYILIIIINEYNYING